MRKKKILLTGASGSVGTQIFKELLKRLDQYQLKIFARESKKNKKLFRPYDECIEITWGDILNLKKCKEAVKDQDIIIHAAALIPPQAYKDPDYTYQVNVCGTENILQAAKISNSEPKIIYTSSIAIYGDRLDTPLIKAEDEPNPNDIYGYTKVKAENLINNSGFEYIIYRLSYVATVDTLRFNPILFRMPLKTPIEVIHVEDVALGIVRSLEIEQLWNAVYNLGGGEKCRITFKKYLNNLLEIMGLGRDYFPESSFAGGGFNCGYIKNNPKLQKFLDYQNHDLPDFYQEVKEWIGVKRYFARIFRWFIKKYLLYRLRRYENYKNDSSDSIRKYMELMPSACQDIQRTSQGTRDDLRTL
ncbi:MAG: hypothetical protein BAJALOKI3v1_530019 [Promethearchaeota archaeon]|nr:MAG: hypothetical protein BAJALOKI3v1_530019 [Candidatus Lokiarchaeota archaeon]